MALSSQSTVISYPAFLHTETPFLRYNHVSYIEFLNISWLISTICSILIFSNSNCGSRNLVRKTERESLSWEQRFKPILYWDVYLRSGSNVELSTHEFWLRISHEKFDVWLNWVRLTQWSRRIVCVGRSKFELSLTFDLTVEFLPVWIDRIDWNVIRLTLSSTFDLGKVSFVTCVLKDAQNADSGLSTSSTVLHISSPALKKTHTERQSRNSYEQVHCL